MDTLRDELVESQKARSDLLKWKLILVAGVGGAALGFSGKGPGNAHLALAVLPLACAYIDLLCRNLSLRNKAIGLFLEHGEHSSPGLRAYEDFYSEIHDEVWNKVSLESWALRGSTYAVCVGVLPVGILAGASSWNPWSWPAGLFYASSLAGLALSKIIDHRYRSNMDGAIRYADEKFAGRRGPTAS